MRIPLLYPNGGPLFWRNEESGELIAAVGAYLNNRIEGTPISPAQVDLMREYLRHWINAPCWKQDDPVIESAFDRLKLSVYTLRNANDISQWLRRALDLGIDPL